MDNRSNNSLPLADIIKQVLDENNLGSHMLEQLAITKWPAVVGPTVVRATNSLTINNGIITVALNSSVIRQELFMLKSDIIRELNKQVGTTIVKDIIFR